MKRVVLLAVLMVVVGSSVWGQGITSDDDIETDGQLVSKVGTGTAPLAVSSETTVRNLSADFLDGKHGNAFALYAELLAAVGSLDNPDPPCFDNTHRFVDCGNGTVTDTVSGLIWLEEVDCIGQMDWATANQTAALLFDGATIGAGGGDCGLSDGSRPGDWRLATTEEWKTIMKASCTQIPLVGNGSPAFGCFIDNEWANGVLSTLGDNHWTSLAAGNNATVATVAYLDGGVFGDDLRTNSHSVWPVRTGHSLLKRMRNESCPGGHFVSGFDPHGELVCAEIPGP